MTKTTKILSSQRAYRTVETLQPLGVTKVPDLWALFLLMSCVLWCRTYVPHDPALLELFIYLPRISTVFVNRTGSIQPLAKSSSTWGKYWAKISQRGFRLLPWSGLTQQENLSFLCKKASKFCDLTEARSKQRAYLMPNSEQRVLCGKVCQTGELPWQPWLDNPFGKILVGPNTLSSVIQ